MIPCPGCSRFIRPRAGGCPFCDTVLKETPSPWGPMVAGVVLGLTLTACVGGGNGDDDGTETIVAAYGGADVGITSSPEDSASTDASETSSGDATADSSGGSSGTGTTSADGDGTTTSAGTDAGTGTGGSTSATEGSGG